MYRSTASPSWSRAASHVPGDGPPWRFALVVVIGPNAFGMGVRTGGCAPPRARRGAAADWHIDGGPTRHGAESTIVDLTGDSINVIREGALRRGDL